MQWWTNSNIYKRLWNNNGRYFIFIIFNNIFTQNIDQIELLDSKSKLQEYVQANKMTVIYTLLEQRGESHNPTFEVEAMVGELKQVATSSTKQIAEQLAAKKILDILLKEKK